MPGMVCSCGEILRWTEIPNPIEWLIISETDYESFTGQVDAEEVYRAAGRLLRCPVCGRLWVFWKRSDEPTEYLPRSLTGNVENTQDPRSSTDPETHVPLDYQGPLLGCPS